LEGNRTKYDLFPASSTLLLLTVQQVRPPLQIDSSRKSQTQLVQTVQGPTMNPDLISRQQLQPQTVMTAQHQGT
jgi:hypothetical protein